jgi:hypothetical protein
MSKKHTAVLYVHGIGSPARNSSLSHFLDYFDLYGQSQSKIGIGKPRDFSYKTEVTDDAQVIHYVDFKRIVEVNGKPKVAKAIRVYEAYWVPEAESRYSVLYVCLWLLRRALNPFRLVFSSWRNFPSFRLACLHELAASRRTNWIEKLERAYRDFENWENRRKYPKGSFTEFDRFLRDRPPTVGTTADDLSVLAREWSRNTRQKAVRRAAKVAIGLFGSIAVAVVECFLCYRTWEYISEGMPNTVAYLYVMVTIGSLLGLVVVGKSARNYSYDVLTWTIDSERDQRFQTRERVVAYTRKLIRYVAGNEACEEFFIVSHSLGSSIAAEALLEEGRIANAGSEKSERLRVLEKLHTIFTIGSPIDLIFNFFQIDTTYSHRYNRLREDQRPSLSLPPFRIDGKAGRARLVNIWSRFDPISAPVTSLRKSISERRDAIANLEAIPSGVPRPIDAHTSYYADRTAMSVIYSAVMDGSNKVNTDDQSSNGALGIYGPWVNLLTGAIAVMLVAVFAVMPGSKISIGFVLLLLIWVFIARRWRKRVLKRAQLVRGPFLQR